MKTALALAAALVATSTHVQDGLVWGVATPKQAEASLTYGGLWSHSELLILSCAPKSGQIQLYAVVRKTPATSRAIPASVTLSSGVATATLRGAVAPDQTRDVSIARTEFSTQAPFVAAFKKTGVIDVTALGETIALPPAPKGAVRKFFGACK